MIGRNVMMIDIDVTDCEIIDILNVIIESKTVEHNISINVTGVKHSDINEFPVTFTFSTDKDRKVK